MPKRSKKFEEISHGPFRAIIRLDSENGTFSCQYGEEIFESTTLAKVRVWAGVKLRAMAKLDWQPILSVSFDTEDTRVNNLVNCTSLELYIERFYIAYDGKRWAQTPWVVMPPGHHLCSGPNASDMDEKEYEMPQTDLAQERIARSKSFYAAEKCGPNINFPLKEESALGKAYYYVPYTEERWLTMIGIIEKIRELRARIHTMLAQSSGWNQLAAIAGTKLLAPINETQ